jgi:hypothetical protein
MQTFWLRQSLVFLFSRCPAKLGRFEDFLPLFNQVDLPIFDYQQNDASSFLAALIALFGYCCELRPDIRGDFFSASGCKCLAHCISRLSPSTIQRATITQLSRIYADLKLDEHKSVMLSDIWLNSGLWMPHSLQTRIAILRDFIRPLLNNPAEVHLLLKVQRNSGIIEALIQMKFGKADHNCLTAAAILIIDDVPRHLELLTHVLAYLTDGFGKFPHVFERRRFYVDLVVLFASPHPEVRLLALQILIHIFQLQLAKEILSPPIPSPRQFSVLSRSLIRRGARALLSSLPAVSLEGEIVGYPTRDWRMIQ